MKAFFYLFCVKFYLLIKEALCENSGLRNVINDKVRTQMHYARQGIITEEMKYVAQSRKSWLKN